MKRLLFLFITAFLGLHLSAQHRLDWVNFPNTAKGINVWIDDMKADDTGNTYTRQSWIGAVNGHPVPYYEVIIKQDGFGNVVWVDTLYTTAMGEEVLEPLLVQQNGFLYTPGYRDTVFSVFRINEASGAIDNVMSSPIPLVSPESNSYGIFEGSNGMVYTYWKSFGPTSYMYMFESDSAGTLLNTYKYSIPYTSITFSNIWDTYTDGEGNLYTQYYVYDSASHYQNRLVKFYSNGALAYDAAFDQGAEENTTIKMFAVDSAGNSYWVNNNVINKLDTALNILWAYSIPQPDESDALYTALDKNGNSYFFVEGTYGADRDYFIKLHSDGTPAYQYHFPLIRQNGFTDVFLADNGDVFLPAILNMYPNINAISCQKEVMALTRLDSTGNVKELFYDTIFYNMGEPDGVARHAVLSNGDVYMTAYFTNPTAMDYAPTDPTLYNMPVGLWYTVKLCQVCGKDNVTGKVGIDTAAGCLVDSSSPPGINSMVLLSPGTRQALVDDYGVYQFSQVPPGNYSASVLPPVYLFSDCDSVYTVVVDSAAPYNNYNFSVAPVPGCNMSLEMTGTRARAGYLQRTRVAYFNQMWQPATGMLAVTLDSVFIFSYASPAPDSVSGNTYFWKFNGLQPYFQQQVNIYSVISFADISFDNFYHLNAALYTNCNGFGSAVAADTLTDFVYNSFDPNEKDVFPLTDRKYNQFINKNEPISFQVNFQNTGNDTALRVVVRDTIDPNFNIKTIQFTGSSSPCQMTIGPNRDVAFTFINIELPPADTNLDMSYGYVKYSILPANGISLGQYVSNQASIYFDFNNPVATNTATLQYVSNFYNSVNTIAPDSLKLTLYPNPATDNLIITTQNFTPKTISIYDDAGRLISTLPFKNEIDISTLSSGVYFMQVTGAEGVVRKRVVKM